MVELFDSLYGRTRFAHVGAVLYYILQPTEAASDIISGRLVRQIFRQTCVKFRDPCLSNSREIIPEACRLKIYGTLQLQHFRPIIPLHSRPTRIAVCRLYRALCFVAKRCTLGLWRIHKSNRNTGATFRLVAVSTIYLRP